MDNKQAWASSIYEDFKNNQKKDQIKMTSEKKEGSSTGKKVFWIILSIVMIGLLIWQVTTGLERIKKADENVKIAEKDVAKAKADLEIAKRNYDAYCASSDLC